MPREKPSIPAPQRMPDLIWQTLYSRGVSSQEKCEKFLSPKLKDLRDPLSIVDMDKAVQRLVEAFKSKEDICVYGDFDLDGTSGVALLKAGFEALGFPQVHFYQPKRLSEGYGVHIHALDEIAKKSSLVVTVDVGITAVEAIEHANQIGLDVIITDHHLQGEELPKALAVVNPNRKDCSSELGHLCGAGVGFYLLMALRRALQSYGEGDALDLKELLDCFVIGTLTDLVPLIDENRVLAKHGLVQLQKTKRPGLRRLLAELGLAGRPLTGQDVAIRFAPKINALSRMEKTVRAVDLFLVEDEDEAKELVVEVMKCNEERVSLQASAEALAEKEHLQGGNDKFIWVASESFHRGVVGLVATKLSKAYGVPTFIGSIGEAGEVVGSARLPDDSEESLLEALESVSTELVKFGGHRAAAGFELEKEKIEKVRSLFSDYWKQKNSGQKEEKKSVYFDGKLRLSEVSPQFMKWFDGIGPFGVEFEIPSFLFSGNEVVKVRKLRGGHLKLTLRQMGASIEREALWFSPPSDHELSGEKELLSQWVDVLAEPQWNYFAGRQTIQLLIKGIRTSDVSDLVKEEAHGG